MRRFQRLVVAPIARKVVDHRASDKNQLEVLFGGTCCCVLHVSIVADYMRVVKYRMEAA